jgi:hypothetical protein
VLNRAKILDWDKKYGQRLIEDRELNVLFKMAGNRGIVYILFFSYVIVDVF